MGKKYLIIIALLVLANTGLTQNSEAGSSNMMIESASRYSFDETVEKISESISGKAWRLITTHNMQETMKKNGKDVLPIKILELCNPEIAYSILSPDEYRSLSPMLPCRLSVYTKEDGKTYISRMNMPLFSGMLSGEASQSVMRAYNESEDIIKELID